MGDPAFPDVSGQTCVGGDNLKDLGILIGLLLTDGCVTKTKSNNWKIVFTGKSEALHQIFREKMRKLFNVRKFTEWFDRFGIKSTEVHSKRIVKFLTSIVPTFRTLKLSNGSFPNAKIPEFIFNLEREAIREILRVMFSADGCVCFGVKWNKTKKSWQFTRKIKFTSKHPVIRFQIAKLLEKLCFNPKIEDKNVILERKGDIIKFQKEIGFVKGVKVTKNSKNWEGFDKNDILKLVVISFNFRKTQLKRFKNKEEIIKFFKNLLINFPHKG